MADLPVVEKMDDNRELMSIRDASYKHYLVIKRPLRDACLCMEDLQTPPAPHFFLITL